MSKNINTVPKGWKSTQDYHKTTNSLIIDNNGKTVHQPVMVQVKNLGAQKITTIQRHYSQEDFRKYSKPAESNFPADPVLMVSDEYFPESPSSCYKSGKLIRSIQKVTKGPMRQGNREKNFPEALNLRINHGLKETSSTQSAEIMKPMPAYMRSKLVKGNTSRQNQYFHKRLSTPRSTNLRRQNFRIILKLGEGKFGKVFMAKEIHTGIVLAMKIIEKKKILEEKFLDQFIRELKIQSFLNHPNIISLYGYFADETHFYALMQLGCDGQLYQLISSKKILTEQTTSFIIKNLLEAIHYIHANKVLHRDIKPENIVLVMGNVKICDFGWAVNKMHPGELRNTFCGTPLYLSPEILQGNRYDEKVDLWAVGILAFELYIGTSPFEIFYQTDLMKITTDEITFPENREVSAEFKQFISSMLTKNPQERLTSQKLLQMDFITKYRDFETCEELCK